MIPACNCDVRSISRGLSSPPAGSCISVYARQGTTHTSVLRAVIRTCSLVAAALSPAAIMLPAIVVPRSLRIGEIVALTLGFGLSTLAVSARTYTKARIMRNVKAEDCADIYSSDVTEQ